MNDRLQTIVITVALFLSGLLVGVWTQRSRPFPPPPIPLMGEFAGPRVLGESRHHHFHHFWHEGYFGRGDLSPEEMRRKLAALEPQIQAFKSNIAGIEGDFRKGFDAILTPAQKSKLDDIEARHHRHFGAGPMPGCAGELGTPLIPIVIYRPLLDRMTGMLALTPAQHDQLESLLAERRTRFLKFVDDNPPPSFHLRDMMRDGPAPGGGSPAPSPLAGTPG
ncbi:MAG TPA: hypothetical protein VMV27_16850 [Candidatus Binataceae bacterium]|nr:hypothetical protein [Candidatus Binataceae bacterium]